MLLQWRKRISQKIFFCLAFEAVLLYLAPPSWAPDKVESRPRFSQIGTHSVEVYWRSSQPGIGRIAYAPLLENWITPPEDSELFSDLEWKIVDENTSRPTTSHHLRLSSLSPGQRYALVTGIKGSQERSPIYYFATRPGPGETIIQRIPFLVVIYTPLTYRDRSDGLPPGKSSHLTPEDLRQIRGYLEEVRSFYWRNSGAKLDLSWDYSLLDKTLNEQADVERQFEQDVELALQQTKKKIEDYAGVLFLYGWDEYLDPVKASQLYRGQAFGGLTYGTEAPWKHKKTPHSWIHFHHRANITWTVVHELHHQIDSLFHSSGWPEYPSNHPDPREPKGVFGEHYDVNAFILRTWPRDQWNVLRWGKAILAKDLDNDGLPDSGPLPLTEAKWGTDPAEKDTDGDGLSDLREMMATSGIYEGLEEHQAQPIFKPNPLNPDSDKDGAPDGKDPYPLYPIQPFRPRRNPSIDGQLSPREWVPFSHAREKNFSATTYFQWDGKALYFALESNKPLLFHLDIDAANNGWFSGSDNYRLKVAPPQEGTTPSIEVAIFDWDRFFAQPQGYVYWNREKVRSQDILVRASHSQGKYILEIAIPANPQTSLTLRAGKKINVKIGYSLPEKPGEIFTQFEPHQLVGCVLRDRSPL